LPRRRINVCYFIAVGVRDEGARLLELERQKREGFGVTPAANLDIAALFPRGDRLFWVTHGGCSCDLVKTRVNGSDADPEKDRAQYRKEGWSEAKIARALTAKHASKARAPRGQRDDTPRERLDDLLARLSSIAGGVRIFVHMFEGAVDEEKVVGAIGNRAVARGIASEIGLPEDVVVELIPDAG
jgi:hypothetical protein